jgi:hypothetical protein
MTGSSEETLPRVGIGLPLVALKGKSLVSLCTNLVQTRAQMSLLIVEGAYIQLNRALLVKYAREQECTHIFFMDHDMAFPGDTIQRLLDRDKDVVGGAYNQRGVTPSLTTVFLEGVDGERVPGDQLPKDLFRCSALGTGCLLVKMSVFDRIASPWFNLEIINNVDLVQSEDVWFCNQVRKAHIDVWCDPTFAVGHVGEAIY